MDLADPWAHAVLLAAGTTGDGGGASGPLLQVWHSSRPFSPSRCRMTAVGVSAMQLLLPGKSAAPSIEVLGYKHSSDVAPLQRSGSQGRPWPLGALLLVRDAAAPPLVAVQQLLVKGLLHPATQLATLQVRTNSLPCVTGVSHWLFL